MMKLDAVKFLLQKNADKEAINSQGQRPIHLAAAKGDSVMR